MSPLERSVSDTAYLVCESRARRSDISQDVFARDWIAPDQRESVAQLWEEWSQEVYSHDGLEVGLRNRYWLERVRQFVTAEDDAVFVNVGAGLTSYPFLLADPVPTIELDRPSVATYKKARISELREAETLPHRDVRLHAVDLRTEEGRERVRELLRRRCADCPSFVLCEGLVYYLDEVSLQALVDVVRSAQRSGSVLGMDFWEPGVADDPVFRRMERFFAERLGMQDQDYTFVEADSMTSLDGFRVMELTDVVEQEKVFTDSRYLEDPKSVLRETYVTLVRT